MKKKKVEALTESILGCLVRVSTPLRCSVCRESFFKEDELTGQIPHAKIIIIASFVVRCLLCYLFLNYVLMLTGLLNKDTADNLEARVNTRTHSRTLLTAEIRKRFIERSHTHMTHHTIGVSSQSNYVVDNSIGERNTCLLRASVCAQARL